MGYSEWAKNWQLNRFTFGRQPHQVVSSHTSHTCRACVYRAIIEENSIETTRKSIVQHSCYIIMPASPRREEKGKK